MFGDDDETLSTQIVAILVLVDLLVFRAMDEADLVGILLDGA
jgi:chaperone required for assembly of F1-ATPase